MKKILCCLVLIGLVASRTTIPEFYNLNNGSFTGDYSTTYNNPFKSKSNSFGVVSEAGDINNDGIPDFLLANPAEDNERGIVYVIYGKKGSLRQFDSMDDFQPSDGFIIKGSAYGQRTGYSVAAAGDVNGDGIDDIIIGSDNNGNNYFSDSRVAYVLFGRKSSSEFPSVVNFDRLSPNQGFTIFASLGSTGSGKFSVSGAGDVNGDGISDIVIGAGFFVNERVYVIFGSKQGFSDLTLPPAAGKGFTVSGPGGDKFGNSVSKVGDFNGDGVDDFIIGAHAANDKKGRAYIIYGRRQGFPESIQATNGMILEGTDSTGHFGCVVRGAGDFNGDGLQDVIVGAYSANGGYGAAYVIFGSQKSLSTLNMGNLASSSRGFKVISKEPSELGVSVGGGRDVNGDRKSDIILGASSRKGGGAVYIIYGSSSSTEILLENLQPSQGFAMFGSQTNPVFGQYVEMLKDINGDGLDDFIVGVPYGNDRKGAAHVFYLPCPTETHFLSNGACIVKCSANCKHCNSPNTCQTCHSGYGLLHDHCTICNEYTHTLNNGICVERHPDNCAVWNGPEKCEICNPGYGLLHGQCKICPEDTHFLNNGVCMMRCSANCASCSKALTCDECYSGFGFHNGDCITCDPATHILKNGVCVDKRPSNCQVLSDQDICYKCKENFGFIGGNCVTCPSETHILSNGFCKIKYPECPENCAQCTLPNQCDFCSENFGFLNHACMTCPSTHFLENSFCIEDNDAWRQLKDFFGGFFHRK